MCWFWSSAPGPGSWGGAGHSARSQPARYPDSGYANIEGSSDSATGPSRYPDIQISSESWCQDIQWIIELLLTSHRRDFTNLLCSQVHRWIMVAHCGVMMVSWWCHDAMMPWCHGVMMTWYNGAIMTWCHGAIMPWFMMPWCHYAMVPWCHDTMLPWCPDMSIIWWLHIPGRPPS